MRAQAGEALLDAVSRKPATADRADPMATVLANAFRTLLAPTLSSLAADCSPPHVLPHDVTLRQAARALCAPGATAVLVRTAADDGDDDTVRYELLTPRSLLEAVRQAADDGHAGEAIARAVSGCTRPLLCSAEISVIDALHMMQAERASHALVTRPTGEPLALLDTLQLVHASVSHAERSADAQQLHACWGGAAGELGAPTDAAADMTDELGPPIYFNRGRHDEGCNDELIRPEDSISMVGGGYGHGAFGGKPPAKAAAPIAELTEVARQMQLNGALLVKLHDEQSGDYHRVLCMPADGWATLRDALQAKLSATSDGAPRPPSAADEPAPLRAILYEDDDGDRVAISSDESLLEAASFAWRHGRDRLLVTPLTGAAQLTSPSGRSAVGTPSGGRRGRAGARRALEPLGEEDEAAGGAEGGEADGSPFARAAESARAAAALVVSPSGMLRGKPRHGGDHNLSAVSSFLGGLIAASSLAVGAGIVIAAKAAKR